MSPSSRNMNDRVTGSSAATSLATKFSPIPRPTTTRAAGAGKDQLAGVARTHHGERVGSFEFRYCLAHRGCQFAGFAHVVPDPVSDHFRVGFRLELEAVLFQVVAQFLVIFDDAVVHDRNVLLGHVRVRIGFVRHAVSCPARVRDAAGTLDRIGIERLLQFLDLAGPANALDGVAVTDRDARRVVAAVFEPAKALHQDRDDISLGDGPDDSTHS